MDAESLLTYCLAKPGAWPDDPWGDHTVAKVGPGERGKIFAFVNDGSVGIKAAKTREEADAWLTRYPGYATAMAYIGRSGWNNLALAGAIPEDEIREAIDESYALVVGALPKKHRPEGWDTP